MILLLIRYFFLTICANYVIYKTLNASHSHFLISSAIIACIVSGFAALFSNYSPFSRILIMLLATYILVFLYFKLNPIISITITFISYGFSYLFLFIAGTIICIPLIILYNDAQLIPYTCIELPIGILQSIGIYFLFQNIQFQMGINKIIRTRLSYYGATISLILISFIIFVTNNKELSNRFTRAISIILLLSVSYFLLYYWRRRITQTYLESMRRLETLNYENAIADKDIHIKELEDQNAYLGRIIHKYRKTIPAIELSVMELLQNTEGLDATELKQKAESLQIQLDEIHAERDCMFDNYQKQTIASTQTGLHTVDAMLALMEKRAKQDWIRYKMEIAPDIKELSMNSIKETDLLHLLGDLIENAIHAVNATDTKDILIHLGRLNNCLLLEVSDSGVPFDIHTYQKWGNEAYTTHTEDGGSGTGLIDIWNIKKKYKASLYIYEYKTNTNVYTKKISFLFDGKNHFLLKTYRDKEIKKSLIRGDLHVFPHETE